MIESHKQKMRAGALGMDKFYVPPECRQQHKFGYKSDIWSAGVLMFLLLSGSMPFETQEDLDINYYDDQFETEQWQNISVEAKDLIDHILEYKFEERFSALEAMRHPWIVKNSPPPDLIMHEDNYEE